jgi:hypothetical protein
MSLNLSTYEEALLTHKPLKRSRMTRKASLSPKTSLKSKARKHKPKKKRLTTGQWKKKAWKEFSLWVRTRGADEAGINKCVTCGASSHWKWLHAGHFIRGRLNSNLFDERGCWAQCYSCNVGRQGHVVVYYKFMLAKFGQEVIDELMRQNDQTHKWLPGELQSIWEKYKALNAENPLLRDEA